jgi:hypothetical protein
MTTLGRLEPWGVSKVSVGWTAKPLVPREDLSDGICTETKCIRAINIFEHRSAAWARSRFQRCLRPPRSFPDQRIRIGETASKM